MPSPGHAAYLAAAVRFSVSRQSRQRGDTYFLTGRVTIRHSDGQNLTAAVGGTQLYDVTLTLDDDRRVVHCTCPYVDDGVDVCLRDLRREDLELLLS